VQSASLRHPNQGQTAEVRKLAVLKWTGRRAYRANDWLGETGANPKAYSPMEVESSHRPSGPTG
jgi:hypothetical protein